MFAFSAAPRCWKGGIDFPFQTNKAEETNINKSKETKNKTMSWRRRRKVEVAEEDAAKHEKAFSGVGKEYWVKTEQGVIFTPLPNVWSDEPVGYALILQILTNTPTI